MAIGLYPAALPPPCDEKTTGRPLDDRELRVEYAVILDKVDDKGFGNKRRGHCHLLRLNDFPHRNGKVSGSQLHLQNLPETLFCTPIPLGELSRLARRYCKFLAKYTLAVSEAMIRENRSQKP